jgi:hypothetical protein
MFQVHACLCLEAQRRKVGIIQQKKKEGRYICLSFQASRILSMCSLGHYGINTNYSFNSHPYLSYVQRSSIFILL